MPAATIAQTLRTQTNLWGRLATTSVAHFTEHIYVGVVIVVLPVIAVALGLSNVEIGLVIAARAVIAGFSNIPSGLLADLTGRRSLLLGTCLVLLGLGSLMTSFAFGFWTLILLMTFTAMGEGGFHPQSLSILSARYPDRRALALGIHDSSGSLGAILGSLALGALLGVLDWRSTLQIWAVPGLCAGILYGVFCKERSARTLAREGLSRALFRNILNNRSVLVMFLISVFRTMGQTTLLPFLSLYLYQSVGLSGEAVAAYISVLLFSAALAPSFSGWAADRMGRKPLLIAGLAVSAASIALLPTLAPGLPLSAGLAVAGIALWALRPIIFAAAMEIAPPEMTGTLVGFVFTGNQGLSFIAPILIGVCADIYGIGAALGVIGIFPLLAVLVTVTLFKKEQEKDLPTA